MSKIDWTKYFDKIYCIRFLPMHSERHERTEKELKRVGILDSSIFEWKNAFCSPFFEVISKNIKHRHIDTIKNQGAFNCAFMHYECMKMAEAMNYSKILIIEEDLVFLKSLDTIVKILDAMPNTDVCLLDKWCGNPYKWKADLAEKRYYCNEYFRYFDVNSQVYGSAACYAISRKAICTYCKLQEQLFFPADELWNNWGIEDVNVTLTKSLSLTNIGYQKPFAESIHDSNFIGYAFVGLDVNLYEE